VQSAVLRSHVACLSVRLSVPTVILCGEVWTAVIAFTKSIRQYFVWRLVSMQWVGTRLLQGRTIATAEIVWIGMATTDHQCACAISITARKSSHSVNGNRYLWVINGRCHWQQIIVVFPRKCRKVRYSRLQCWISPMNIYLRCLQWSCTHLAVLLCMPVAAGESNVKFSIVKFSIN